MEIGIVWFVVVLCITSSFSVVPEMIPNVTVDDNSININCNNVTLTLSWGEPFNDLDPIVNYTVSCSGDVTCPQNFTTTDNTTRNYTITNLIPMTNYTFSVVATNSNGSGEAGVKMISTPSESFNITNGPINTTVCINNEAEINCGFTGGNPENEIPYWRIINRNDNGSIISNTTGLVVNYIECKSTNTCMNHDLKWDGDINISTNSKLLVGPVNKTHNQSSYQCIFKNRCHGTNIIKSAVGTITVVAPPSDVISVDEICTTSITISLNNHSHPACGDVSYNVTISGNAVCLDTVGGSICAIDELQSDTLYNIIVTSTYNGGFKMFTNSVMTSLPNPPNPICATSIKLGNTNGNDDKTITWKPPEIDRCCMLAVEYYYVNISSLEIAKKIYDTTISFKYPDNNSRYITVNVTVVDTKGQRSNSTLTKIKIGPGTTGNKDSDKNIGSNVLTVILLLLLLSLSLWLLL